MSFTLAHPAAVLPFRRFCPKYFDFSALIVGSIVPDLAASIDDWEYFSHSIAGSFGFCLPVGLLTLLFLRQLRVAVISTLPGPHREALLSLCARPGAKSPLIIIASLLTGSWLHIIWDLFTHDHSWVVHRFAMSSIRLAGVPLHHLLWLLGTLGGLVALVAQYVSLLKENAPTRMNETVNRRAYARWIGICVVPLIPAIPLALRDLGRVFTAGAFARAASMYYLGCLYVALVLVGYALRCSDKHLSGQA